MLASQHDFGLLVTIATARTSDDAEMLRGVLQGEGIRATTGPAADGTGIEVLVFRADASRARDLVRS